MQGKGSSHSGMTVAPQHHTCMYVCTAACTCQPVLDVGRPTVGDAATPQSKPQKPMLLVMNTCDTRWQTGQHCSLLSPLPLLMISWHLCRPAHRLSCHVVVFYLPPECCCGSCMVASWSKVFDACPVMANVIYWRGAHRQHLSAPSCPSLTSQSTLPRLLVVTVVVKKLKNISCRVKQLLYACSCTKL
jgi:hypothetical protein